MSWQHVRPARFLLPVPDGVDAAEAVCIPLAYLTAFQMLTRYRRVERHASRRRALGELMRPVSAARGAGNPCRSGNRHPPHTQFCSWFAAIC